MISIKNNPKKRRKFADFLVENSPKSRKWSFGEIDYEVSRGKSKKLSSRRFCWIPLLRGIIHFRIWEMPRMNTFPPSYIVNIRFVCPTSLSSDREISNCFHEDVSTPPSIACQLHRNRRFSSSLSLSREIEHSREMKSHSSVFFKYYSSIEKRYSSISTHQIYPRCNFTKFK